MLPRLHDPSVVGWETVPENKNLPLVPVFSSFRLPGDLVTQLARNGVYAPAMGDEAKQVLNFDADRGR